VKQLRRRRPADLCARLEAAAARFGSSYLASDPVVFPHRYSSRADREIVAFLAAALAYGNVKQIQASVERVLTGLSQIHPSPAVAIGSLTCARAESHFSGFRHRFNDHRDLAVFLTLLRRMLSEFGSVEGFFAAGPPPGAPLRERLSSFVRRALELEPQLVERAPGARFFLPDPESGSACKRLCMVLRWLVRPADGVDLGLWTTLTTRELVMPLDTHTSRIAYANGLSRSPYATWSNAEEVTAALARYDRNDPVRFDFALSRLGILRVPQNQAPLRLRAARRP